MTIAQYLSLAKAVGIAFAVAFVFGYGVHLGEKIVKGEDARAVVAQQTKEAKAIADATIPLNQQISVLKSQLAAAPAPDAPHIRLCIPTGTTHVPAVHSAGSSPPGPANQPAVVQGPDIGPVLDKRFADDDSRVRALQTYVTACIASGRCAAPVAATP